MNSKLAYKEHYLEAMYILEKDGWIKGAFNASNDSPHCVIGALARAVGANYVIRQGPPVFEVTRFNDASDTSLGDVLTWLAFGAAGAFEGL